MSPKTSQRWLTPERAAIVAAVLTVIGTVVAAIITGLFGLLDNGVTSVPTTSIASLSTVAETATETPTETPTPTEPAGTPTPIVLTETPTEIDVAALAATLATQETATAQAIVDMMRTQAVLDQTVTATWWTDTPTPNITASIDAYRTQQAATATAQANRALLEAALQRAASFTGSNTDWEPFAYVFPNDPAESEMVLVPVGRFMMGSRDGADDERPEHEQVIATPYWIDQMEVTRGQYGRCVAAGACTEVPSSEYSIRDTQPINQVAWFQARDYCMWRGMRLPTEVEWEYAARGPAGWIYPWGDEWDPDNAVYRNNSGYMTADVGSRPVGASWVGALDLSGNVWEWANSLYLDYPYGPDHESSMDSYSTRVLRGGSFGSNIVNLGTANRDKYNPYSWDDGFGFRCVRP